MSQKDNTMRSEKPVELRIPMPWGHVSAKAWGNPLTTSIPIMGIHGWMDNAGTFDRIVPFMPKNLYFVSVDLPGHGLSTHLPQGMPYHFGDFLIIIKRISKYFKWSRFSIMGHSMGGGLAAYFSSLYPSLIDRVVMLDMIKPMSSDEGPTSESMSQAMDHFLSLEEKIKQDRDKVPTYSFQDAMNRLITATDNSLTEDAAKCLMTRGTVRVDEEKLTFRRDLRMRCPSIYRFSHEQSLNLLKGIKCHLLLIKAQNAPNFGGPDEIIKRTLEVYKENCASFKYVEVEGNHFVHLNEPEKIAEIVNKFLAADDSGSRQKSGL